MFADHIKVINKSNYSNHFKISADINGVFRHAHSGAGDYFGVPARGGARLAMTGLRSVGPLHAPSNSKHP
jgi:hypothetical protein